MTMIRELRPLTLDEILQRITIEKARMNRPCNLRDLFPKLATGRLKWELQKLETVVALSSDIFSLELLARFLELVQTKSEDYTLILNKFFEAMEGDEKKPDVILDKFNKNLYLQQRRSFCAAMTRVEVALDIIFDIDEIQNLRLENTGGILQFTRMMAYKVWVKDPANQVIKDIINRKPDPSEGCLGQLKAAVAKEYRKLISDIPENVPFAALSSTIGLGAVSNDLTGEDFNLIFRWQDLCPKSLDSLSIKDIQRMTLLEIAQYEDTVGFRAGYPAFDGAASFSWSGFSLSQKIYGLLLVYKYNKNNLYCKYRKYEY